MGKTSIEYDKELIRIFQNKYHLFFRAVEMLLPKVLDNDKILDTTMKSFIIQDTVINWRIVSLYTVGEKS